MSDRKKVLELFEQFKDSTNKRVEEGVEKNKKTRAEIILKTKDGAAVSDAKVSVNQLTHDFKYGANLFMLDELESEEKNEKYKKYFKELFNIATLPFYWNSVEPERGKQRYDKNSPNFYRRPPIDLCMEFCEENNIEPREHALAYELFFPEWLADKDVNFVKKELERRMKEISGRYASKIPTIEVTNEMYWEKGKTKFYNEPDYVEYCFELARKYFPDNQLCINEWAGLWSEPLNNRNRYYMQIERAVRKKAPIDVIGMQYHLFFRSENEYDETRKYYNPNQLFGVLDMFSDFNLPIQITEVTIPAYSQNQEDEELQAEILKTLYSIWFSHEKVEQIIYWNLADGYAHAAEPGDMTAGENYYYGGLLRFDLTPKPAYYAIKELFEKVWRTNESCKSDADGKIDFRGFFGEYNILIEYNGNKFEKKIHLSKDGDNTFEIMI